MTIIDTDGTSHTVTNESQLNEVLGAYGYRLRKIESKTSKLRHLERELSFELKHEAQSLMPDFTAQVIEKLKAEILTEQENCLVFKTL